MQQRQEGQILWIKIFLVRCNKNPTYLIETEFVGSHVWLLSSLTLATESITRTWFLHWFSLKSRFSNNISLCLRASMGTIRCTYAGKQSASLLSNMKSNSWTLTLFLLAPKSCSHPWKSFAMATWPRSQDFHFWDRKEVSLSEACGLRCGRVIHEPQVRCYTRRRENGC